MQGTLTLRAHAKVNLALAIGKASTPGGLHRICSWMHAIELSDRIEIRPLSKGQESVYAIGWAQPNKPDEPVDWDVEQDLAAGAHKLLEAHVGHQLGAAIRVSKSIPAGGGLGGGSSDAASVLMGINTLFDLQLDQTTLIGLAMELGSDIPFFLDPGKQIPRAAIVEGFGDTITRVETNCSGEPITLIFPGFGCHTGRVYQAFDAQANADHAMDAAKVKMLASERRVNPHGLLNDLASAAMKVAPELGEIQCALQSTLGEPVHVSGSGSTLFVLGSVEPDQIAQVCPGCSIVQTRLC